jgi:hypothetical protein
MEKEPSLNRFVMTVAVIAVVVLSLEVGYVILSSSPAGISGLSGPDDEGGSHLPDDYEPWTEPTVLPPPGYLDCDDQGTGGSGGNGQDRHSFMRDYNLTKAGWTGGTQVYFQNLTVRNGTVNTTFEVDASWFCVHVFVYVMGPINISEESKYEEYWINSSTGEGSSGGTGYWSGEGGSSSTGWLYNEGPYGTWTLKYTILNGEAIIWIEGYQGTASDFGI